MIVHHKEDALTHALNVMIRTCVLKTVVTRILDAYLHLFLMMIMTNVLKILAVLNVELNM
jgi:formylmethanofuran:tetrahydromethanopterin formyltransferase